VNTNKLRYIVAVDRYGSMSAAAEAIHVSQPSLTRTVAELEKELGFALFERRARGMRATALGRNIIDRAARILADIDQLSADARTFREYRESQLRLCISPPPLVSLLNSALPQLLQYYPRLKIEIKSVASERAVSLLRAGDADMIVGSSRALKEYPELKTIPIRPFAGCFFVSASHPLAKVKKVTPKDILDYPLVLPERDGGSPEITSKLLGKTEIPPDHQIHIIGYFPLVCEVVAATDAVAFVGRAYRNNVDFLKRFSLLPVEYEGSVELCCAHRHDTELSAPERALIEMMQ
jgi:DNA-binding transcriptional LysR family regulator